MVSRPGGVLIVMQTAADEPRRLRHLPHNKSRIQTIKSVCDINKRKVNNTIESGCKQSFGFIQFRKKNILRPQADYDLA